jgi:predicted dithiol-disulfide oxidoreductase (DUF899 family)
VATSLSTNLSFDLTPNLTPSQQEQLSSTLKEIQTTEKQISELISKLEDLRRQVHPTPVKNYRFQNFEGEVTLEQLFGDKNILFMIHNMGQACRYCTLWADGINAFLPHFEDRFSVVMVSKDAPATQRQFASSRHWGFRLASHGGGEYIQEQTVNPGSTNMPGVVCYVRKGKEIYRKNAAVFGPGDLFCSMWHFLALAGENESSWFPQFNYWKAPKTLDDGGKNLPE